MPVEPKLLNPQPVLTTLNGQFRWVLNQALFFDQLSSTNSWLMQNPSLLKQPGLVICTTRQTAGRGQRGSTWQDLGGEQLYCSVVLHPQVPDVYLTNLPLWVGLAVHRLLQHLGVESAKIKWPNDLWVKGRKIGGILCEMHQPPTSDQKICVIGIGLNLKTGPPVPPSLKPILTTLAEHLAQPPERDAVLVQLLHQLDEVLSLAYDHQWNLLTEEWSKHCLSIGLAVRCKQGGQWQTGTVKGVDERGRLCVHTNQGLLYFYDSRNLEYLNL